MKTNTFHAKKVLALLFTALLPLVASAEKVEIDGIWYNLISKGKVAEVTYKGDYSYSYDEYSGSITIPATVTYDGVAYSVTSIGYGAFDGCSSLTAITIPEGVTSIGDYAFYGCSSLTTITIPESLTSIGDQAFWACTSLTTITIPEGVTSIGENAFALCSSLTAINIPEGVTSIGENAFALCSSLTAITIPEGVTSIGDRAFLGCSSLTAINIPEGVTSIGVAAFADCSSLTDVYCYAETVPSTELSAFDDSNIGQATLHVPASALESYKATEPWSTFGTIVASAEKVEIDGIWYNLIPKAKRAEVRSNPDGETKYSGSITIPATVTYDGVAYSVTSIGESAFAWCISLTAINIPEGVTSIGESAFVFCSSLTAINIPEGVTSIGDWAFDGCSSLTAINIPDNSQLTSIGEGAFALCSSLTAINIPEGVTSIGESAFAWCSSLTYVYCYAETVPSTELSAFDDSNIGQATLHVPANAQESYKATEPWSRFGTIVALTDEEMGVEQLTIDNAQLTIYDLHGRRVATPTKDGIYIVNGRKVMVKIGM